jgi:DNA-binding IclR family transcriptional regulator
MTQGAATSQAGTRSVQRALALLIAVAGEGGTLSELARRVELSPSTASRLLTTLCEEGFAWRDASGSYGAGPRLRQLAGSALRADHLYELAGPHLESLSAETGETANLAVPADGERALYLRQVASPKLVLTGSWVGRTISRRGTAVGGALAGRVESDGFCTRSGTIEPDVTSIAAPVYGAEGEVVAALSLLAPSYRTTAADVRRYGARLAAHAAELSAALGAPETECAA